MTNQITFLRSQDRLELIRQHQFYVEQSKKRLLDQFTDEAISIEATRTEWESLQFRLLGFDASDEYPDHEAEEAFQDGAERHDLLHHLRHIVRFTVVAGFFHEWEKNLRNWLIDEARHSNEGECVIGCLQEQNFANLMCLLESSGWRIRNEPYFTKLDACRMVVNVHKHGDGNSLESLKSKYPEFLKNPDSLMQSDIDDEWFGVNHKFLKVSDEQIADFGCAISKFWEDIPENTISNQIDTPPEWLVVARSNDNNKK